MMYFTRFIISLFVTSQICGVTVAQDSLNVRMLGEVHHFVNQCYDVAMLGDYAYISSGLASGLRVVDLSNPTAPVEVGYSINSDPCPEVPMWMADRVIVSGDYAYVLYFDGTWSFGHYRLYAYDVSNSCAPQQMGYVSLPDNCTSQFVEGDHVYVTISEFDGFCGVKVIDVSDPRGLVEVGSFETPGYPQSVYVADTIAYIADNNALVVYDVADPGSPVELGSYSPEGEMALIHHVAVQGDYVYVIDANFGVRILDASDFSRIEQVGALPHNQKDAHFSRMEVSGDLVYYLQDGDISGKKLVILDVTDPRAPLEIGSHDMPGSWWFYGFDCCDEHACIAAGQEGLRVVDVSVPDSIVDVAMYDFYDLTLGLAVSEDHAFVGTYMRNLLVYDVSDPSSPIQVTSLDFPDSPIKQISAWGDHLYVPGVTVDHNAGVSVLDISDPTAPEEIAYWPAFEGYSGAPFNVERYGDYAFLACAFGGVEIYDVTDIAHPVPLGNWTLWDPLSNPDFGVTNVKISWPYLFAPDRAFGLYVLDVSDPTRITAVAGCETPGDAMWADISPDHNHVYVADFDGGLRVIDVSDPLAPVEAGFHEGALERATHIATCGDSVYVSDGGEIGLHVFDVSDPTSPREVAYHETPGVYGHDVAVSGGFVYFLDFTHFEIFQTVVSGACGDCNGDGKITFADALYVKNYYYQTPPGSPAPIGNGDVNLDKKTTFADALYIKNYYFQTPPGSPPPCQPPEGYSSYSDEPATVGFSSPRTENGIVEIPVCAQFGVPSEGVGLEVAYDHRALKPLMPELTSRTEGLDLCCNPDMKKGRLLMGVLALTTNELIQPGDGAVVMLRFKSVGSEVDLSSLRIEEAIVVDEQAREMKTTVLGYPLVPPLPKVFSLSQNYPNPFWSQTLIQYALPGNGEGARRHVLLRVYDSAGRLVKTLVDGERSVGYHVEYWDGTDQQNHRVPSGIYFCELSTGGFASAKKMIVLR